jgi:cytochrome c-type biogenesis protein
MVSGLSAAELVAASNGSEAVVPAATATATVVAANRRALFIGIGLFIGGFTIVFVALGAAASGIGHVLHTHVGFLTDLSGVIVIVLGFVLLLSAAPAEFWVRLGTGPGGAIARLTGERRFAVKPSQLGLWAAPVMGMAFAFAWTPCVGPVLGPILGLAANNGKLVGGVVLLFAYSLGLGLPFLATGLAFERLTAAFARARRTLGIIQLVAALILIVFGILLITGNEAWLSTQFNTLLDHIGLSRLSKS